MGAQVEAPQQHRQLLRLQRSQISFERRQWRIPKFRHESLAKFHNLHYVEIKGFGVWGFRVNAIFVRLAAPVRCRVLSKAESPRGRGHSDC